MSLLRNVDLIEVLLDNNVLSAIAAWLSPLPDDSLPNIKIRESLIKFLVEACCYQIWVAFFNSNVCAAAVSWR